MPIPVRATDAYPRVRMPEADQRVPLKEPRVGRPGLLSIAQAAFVERLRGYFPVTGPVSISGDCYLTTGNTARPYQPAIVLRYERAGLCCLLDVEIDAPYDAEFRQPTHCRGDDDSRDLYFTRRGWIVVRFAEIQVWQQPEACCGLLTQLLARLDPAYQAPSGFERTGFVGVDGWDVPQAQAWEKTRHRETYLGVEDFGRYDTEVEWQPEPASPLEAAIEELVSRTTALPEPPPSGPLLRASPDPRHAALRFDAPAHRYYINGQPAMSVSTLYKRFFPEFDQGKWAAIKAQQWECTAEEVAREWDAKRDQSSAAGSALHQQIETFYNNGTAPPEAGPDFAHFLAFHHDHPHLVPHRTEWQIYHEDLLLAGTVDFVTRNPDGSLSIYDWKRSHKVIDQNGQPLSNAYQTAEGPLKDLPDCPFSHYSLQLNIYKWLLETKYGRRVRDIHLVVLHPALDRYHVVPVAEYPRHVERMMAALRAAT